MSLRSAFETLRGVEQLPCLPFLKMFSVLHHEVNKSSIVVIDSFCLHPKDFPTYISFASILASLQPPITSHSVQAPTNIHYDAVL